MSPASEMPNPVPSEPRLWIRDATVLPMAPSPATVLQHTDILVQGGRITAVQPTSGSVPDQARVIDGRGKLVLPGLVNCHTHIDMALFRGTGEGARLMDWLALVTQVQAGMSDEDIRWSTRTNP